jgi:hypothetical protein
MLPFFALTTADVRMRHSKLCLPLNPDGVKTHSAIQSAGLEPTQRLSIVAPA